ncbi:MAG TPA: acetyltransferase [Desulfobacterales bacterium]|nr:acetyltransferase [Desulfobacterales bacterium]
MRYFDVFNGDADGICALHQLRLAAPRPEAHLITGVKRNIKLLEGPALNQAEAGDEITVLDISMSSNHAALLELLKRGCLVFYVDHHFSGDIPDTPLLSAHIDPAPEVCTSMIVDRLLSGRYRPWAVAAAFGDNLHEAARHTAAGLNLSESELDALRELGELLNYNGYGAVMDDLHFRPDELYQALHPFTDPFDFIAESEALSRLRQGYENDMERARDCAPLEENEAGRIYQFPAASWSKRVAGVFINERAREREDLAHALLVDNGDNTLMVSVRAPLTNRQGADALCLNFPTGGGRRAAAGINALPEEQSHRFARKFIEVFAS